jgi:hypothetical protein
MAVVKLYDGSLAGEAAQHRLPALRLRRERRHGDRRLLQTSERGFSRLERPTPEPTHGGALGVVGLAVGDEKDDFERVLKVDGRAEPP